MKRNIHTAHRALLVAMLLAMPLSVWPQQTADSEKKTEYVYLLHADETRFDKDINADAQILVGNVSFRHDSLYMYCDSALFYEETNSLAAYGNIHMNQGDTLLLDGDELYYDGNAMLAKIRYNVRMEDPSMVLTTDSLNYDRTMNLGYYFDWGTLKDSLNTLTSQWGEYDTQTKDAVFNYDVTLTNDHFVLTSDTLGYNTATRIATITGPSDIDSDDNHLYSTLGYYYTEQDQCKLYQRSVYTNDNNRLIGDSLFYDRTLHYGEAFHNVVLDDYKNSCRLTGDYIYYNELNDSAYATQQAIAIDYSQGDSLFIHGDTLRLTTHTKINVPDKKSPDKAARPRPSRIGSEAIVPDSMAVSAIPADSIAVSAIPTDSLSAQPQEDAAEPFATHIADTTTTTHIHAVEPDSTDSLNQIVTEVRDSTEAHDVVQAELADSTVLMPWMQPDSLASAYTAALAQSLPADTAIVDSLITYRIIEAYRKVRIYRSDVQAVCDSLVFNSLDSCATLYYDPIIWNGNQQVLGEKIMIYLNDSTISWAHIENQALMVEQLDTAHYNQISGRDIKAYFRNGEIDHTDVEGNVEVIYYYREEGDTLFVGMNTTEASLLTAYMVERQVDKLFITGKSNGVFYPMDQIPSEKRKLSAFGWFSHIRPLSSYDILYWRGKTSEQKLKKTNRSAVPLPTLNGIQP